MTKKSQSTQAITALVALILLAAGCAKKREAALPEEMQASVFTITEIENSDSAFKVETAHEMSKLTVADSSKATSEKGMVAVVDAQVSNRLSFMFKGLEISGKPDRAYNVVLSVDKQYVTAYKVAKTSDDLSILEKRLAKSKEEVLLQKQLQKAQNYSETKAVMLKLQEASKNAQTLFTGKAEGVVLVPLFKYKVSAFGTMARAKNEMKEETTKLNLSATEWAKATHVQLEIKPEERLLTGIETASRADLDRTYVTNSLTNKVMTAETLQKEYKIPVNLEPNTQIVTMLDGDSLAVFEAGSSTKMQSPEKSARLAKCSEQILKSAPAELKDDCVLVRRYEVPVTYVRPELPAVDYDGNQAAALQFKKLNSNESVGLIQIAEGVEPLKTGTVAALNPRSTIKVAAIKDIELLFRRAILDSATAAKPATSQSKLSALAKIVLEENRVVIHSKDHDDEYMSIPATYLKVVEGSTNVEKTSLANAEYVYLDWSRSTLSIENDCIESIADQKITNLDSRIEKGVVNLMYQYTVMVSSDNRCTGTFANTLVKERVSLLSNDVGSATP